MSLDLPTSQWTLVDATRAQARERPDAAFLSFEDGAGDSLTFGEFDEVTDRVATALADLGVGEGDRVLGLLTNSRAFMVLMIATHKRRAVFVPVNTELKGSFLEHQVHNSEPRVVAADAGLVDRFATVDTTAVVIESTIVVDDGTGLVDDDLPAGLAETRRIDYEDLESTAVVAGEVLTPTPQDTCTIMYTSGTTGPSKGVLMPQAHCYLFAHGTRRCMSLTPEDRYYICMPLFHANGLFMQAYACLVAGCSAHVVKRFSVSAWLGDIIDCGATATNALGVMPEFIYRHPPSERDRDHRLSRVMALPVADDWAADFETRFGVDIIQGYGMTEVNMVCYTDPSEPVESGCAGYIIPEFDVIIGDPETDEALPPDTVGEIMVRPRVPFCFNVGYFKMEDKTVEAWRNLWFHTGDAGTIDGRGRLHFVDRIKDRIRRRGENISSYEVEQVLNGHPSVVESAVVGVHVEGAGGEEEIKAVLAVEGDAPEPVEFLDWCVERMPRYTVPRYLEFVAELDKTASGKIRKQALRDAGVTDTTFDREAVGYRIAR